MTDRLNSLPNSNKNNSWAYTPCFLFYWNKEEEYREYKSFFLLGSASIDSYQFILQQIAYISKSPVKYIDRTFSLVCVGEHDHTSTNEIRIRVNNFLFLYI